MLIIEKGWTGTHGIGRHSNEIITRLSRDKLTGIKFIQSNVLSYRFLFNMVSKNDVYYTPGYSVPLFGKGLIIPTIHDLMHIDYPEYKCLKNELFYKVLLKKVLARAPLVFTVSEFSKKKIIELMGVEKSKVINIGNGISDSFLKTPFVRNKSKYFLFVGNAKPHKNINAMINAFFLSGLNNDYKLKIVGVTKNELISTLNTDELSDSIEIIGPVSDSALASLYAKATATILVSHYEGFGFPLIESMATGTPVITANCTSLPETASDLGVLCDPKSITSISQAYQQVLSFDYAPPELKKYATKYSWESVYKNIKLQLEHYLA